MIYLSGRWHNELGEVPLGLVGYLRQPTGGGGPTSKAPKGTPWAADTGIYGSTPFDLGTYLIFFGKITISTILLFIRHGAGRSGRLGSNLGAVDAGRPDH